MVEVDIEKLKAKSFIQLFSWMEKRGVSSFSEELQRYYFLNNISGTMKIELRMIQCV